MKGIANPGGNGVGERIVGLGKEIGKSGERGIRTPGTLRHTGFRDRSA